jgi:micrococcal nuclease
MNVPDHEGKIKTSVLGVVDGDTIVIDFNGKEEKVRLIGVDTPETVHPKKGVEPFGTEASIYTKELLEGQTIYIEFDVQERETEHGRLLAYVWIEGEHFNHTLVKEGYAVVSTWPPR